MTYPDIFVLRHGQTEWNKAGRHQGQLDSPLTALGAEQATAQGALLAEHARHVRQAFCSPSGRTQQTAAHALTPLGLTPQLDRRLMEVHFGQWQGLSSAEIAAQWPALAVDRHDPFAWNFMSVGGERFDDLTRRAQAFLDGLNAPGIIVTHGILSRVLRGLWLGVGFDAMRELGGGQGVVYHLHKGQQDRLVPAV